MAQSHAKIIELAGAAKVACTLGLSAGTVRMWKNRDRIPAEYWRRLADADITTLDDLATGADRHAPQGASAGEAA